MDNVKPKKSILRSLVGWLVYLLILAALVWGTPWALAKILHTPYPIAAITSGSMWPALKQGDIVLIQGASSKNDLKVGDIAVYKNPSPPVGGSGQVFSKVTFLSANGQEEGASFTIHRVVRLNDTTFVTRGDANNVDDEPVSYSQLIGKAVNFGNSPFRIPYLGELSMMFKK